MENRNHGLAWLQSASNSHVAILRGFSLSCNPFFKIWISLSAMLKTITSWGQRDKTMQESSHSRPKRKSLKIIQIQWAITGEIKQLKTLN